MQQPPPPSPHAANPRTASQESILPSSTGLSPGAIRISVPVGHSTPLGVTGMAAGRPLGVPGLPLGHNPLLGVPGGSTTGHGLSTAHQAYSQTAIPPKNYTALSPQQMVYLMERQKLQQQQHGNSGSSSMPVGTSSGTYSTSTNRGPLAPNSAHAPAVNIPSPRTLSVHGSSSTSCPSSATSHPPTAIQSSPEGLPPPSVVSPQLIPAAASQSRVNRSNETEVPLDLSKSVKPPPLPLAETSRSDGGAGGSLDDPLDLSSQATKRKRKCDDSDDDIICVGVSMPPTSQSKVPRMTPPGSMLCSAGAYIQPQLFQVHHAQSSPLPHRAGEYGPSHQRTAPATPGSVSGNRFEMSPQGMSHDRSGHRTSYGNKTMLNSPHNAPFPFGSPRVRSPVGASAQGKSILDMYIEAYKAGQNFPPRPTIPADCPAQKSSLVHRSPGVQATSNAAHADSVIKTPPQVPAIQARQLMQLRQTALDMQMRKRQECMMAQAHAAKQAHKTISGPGVRSNPPSVATVSHGPPPLDKPSASGVGGMVQTGTVPSLPDTNPERQSNMLKQHPELHNVQIQGGRMLNHNVVQRPAVVVENRAQSSQGAHNTGPNGAPVAAGRGQLHHKHPVKDRITYMMASEPVPACATTNATAIQITQQPTFIGAPLMVPNPVGKVISSYSSGVQTTTSTITTPSLGRGMAAAPSVLKTENQEISQTSARACAANSAQPQKHFINTDTQTADLPGDQWHRPFHRMGVPNKNIPVANVNPMVHTKCGSPALHPKKQILFQSRTAAANGGHVKSQGSSSNEIKREVPSSADVSPDHTRIQRETMSLKPEYSDSRDVKGDMSGHEQYISKIKERIMRRMHQTGSCEAASVKEDVNGNHSSGTFGRQLKRKYTRGGKAMAPLMKKAAQAMKREPKIVPSQVTYHNNQQQGSSLAQTKPVLSKTVLDLSDITGESVDDTAEHSTQVRTPHRRLTNTYAGARSSTTAANKRLGMRRLKDVGLPRQRRVVTRRMEEKKDKDDVYEGETEVEMEEAESNNDTEVKITLVASYIRKNREF